MKHFGMIVASAIVVASGAGCTATSDDALGSAEAATTYAGSEEYAWATCGNAGDKSYIHLIAKKVDSQAQDADVNLGKWRVTAIKGWFVGHVSNPSGRGGADPEKVRIGKPDAPFFVGVSQESGELRGDATAITFVSSASVTERVTLGPLDNTTTQDFAFSSVRIPRPGRPDGLFSMTLATGGDKSSPTIVADNCQFETNLSILNNLARPAAPTVAR